MWDLRKLRSIFPKWMQFLQRLTDPIQTPPQDAENWQEFPAR
jgi:hypothetical protein